MKHRAWGRSARHWLASLPGWAGREFLTLVAVLLISLLVWGFVELVDEVIEGETHTFDEMILLAMRDPHNSADPFGPHWLEELGRDFTALGGTGVLVALTLMVAGALALARKFHTAVFILIAVVSGLMVSLLIKQGVDRPRPELVPHGSYVYTASFPSGHSMLAAVTYLTLGAVLARVLPSWRLKIFVLTMATLLTVLVGLSRVYLGVHWPTDVLGGWSAGAAWALLCWLIARRLQRAGRVETADVEPRMNTDAHG